MEFKTKSPTETDAVLSIYNLKIHRWNKDHIPLYELPENNLANYGPGINDWIHANGLYTHIKVLNCSDYNSTSKRFEKEGFTMTAKRKAEACSTTINNIMKNKVMISKTLYNWYSTREEGQWYIDELCNQLLRFQCIQDPTKIANTRNIGKVTGKVGLDGISQHNDDLGVCFMLGNQMIKEVTNPDGKFYDQLMFVSEYLVRCME